MRSSVGKSRWYRDEKLHYAEEVGQSAEYQNLLLDINSRFHFFGKPPILFICNIERVNLFHGYLASLKNRCNIGIVAHAKNHVNKIISEV